jgi:hypothetical protein
MTRFVGSAVCLALTDLVLKEAESDTGTWSLATYVKIRNMIPRFAATETALFVKRVLELALSPASNSGTRYKLAQILSAIHGLALPEFEHAIRGHLAAMEASYEEIGQSGELGKPTVRLLQSLSLARLPKSASGAELRIRRVSATPAHSPSEVAVGQIPRVGRSPDPGVMPAGRV